MTEYTVTFQKNRRVGTRSFRSETVEANSATEASMKAQALFRDFRAQGYRITRVTRFEDLGDGFYRNVEE